MLNDECIVPYFVLYCFNLNCTSNLTVAHKLLPYLKVPLYTLISEYIGMYTASVAGLVVGGGNRAGAWVGLVFWFRW